VTVVEKGAQLLQNEDPDVGTGLFQLFHDEGIEVLLNTTVLEVEGCSGQEISVRIEGEGGQRVVSGTDLLVAVGRSPNTKSVGLTEAGVALDSRGYIAVNERLETTAANVWAMGDCAGSPQFTHAAFDDFRIVRDNLRGGNRTTRGRLIPSCMFTDPELVRVGLSESEAKGLGVEYRLAKMPIANVLRTRTVSEPRGFMKMLVAADSDRILGFTAFGVDASELLAAVQTAMLGSLPYTTLRDGIFTHPTIAEGLGALLITIPAAV
jgi:pyruvate/2-oxoglutarate dehydrogenase complex dihydrolipoamide dehydrogenase (E3) component